MLDDCHYTFSNTHPDAEVIGVRPGEQISQTEMKAMLNGRAEPLINKWIDGIPYKIGDWRLDPFSSDIDVLLHTSSINIVLETLITPFSPHETYGINLTEKIWKPMFAKKPFLVYGRPGVLKLLRREGFKTFSPFINEDYDLMENGNERKAAIIKEMTRLKKLNTKEFTQLIEKCFPIVKYNYQELMRFKNQPLPESFKSLGIFK